MKNKHSKTNLFVPRNSCQPDLKIYFNNEWNSKLQAAKKSEPMLY